MALQSTSDRVLKTLLRPIVRFALHASLPLQQFIDVLKIVYIELALNELQSSKRKVTLSRLSIMTGVHKKDVQRLHKQGVGPRESVPAVVKVLSQWTHDRRFLTKGKGPRTLSWRGAGSEFYELVYTVSKDLIPGAVLFELERLRLVERTSRGVRLLSDHVSLVTQASEQRYTLLARNVETLLSAELDNIANPGRSRIAGQEQNLNIMTEYDNVYVDSIPKIRAWMVKQGKILHSRARQFISQFDKDVVDRPNKIAGGRVVFSAFSFTEPQSLELPPSGEKDAMR